VPNSGANANGVLTTSFCVKMATASVPSALWTEQKHAQMLRIDARTSQLKRRGCSQSGFQCCMFSRPASRFLSVLSRLCHVPGGRRSSRRGRACREVGGQRPAGQRGARAQQHAWQQSTVATLNPNAWQQSTMATLNPDAWQQSTMATLNPKRLAAIHDGNPGWPSTDGSSGPPPYSFPSLVIGCRLLSSCSHY
jgi:hypothetical protein